MRNFVLNIFILSIYIFILFIYYHQLGEYVEEGYSGGPFTSFTCYKSFQW